MSISTLDYLRSLYGDCDRGDIVLCKQASFALSVSAVFDVTQLDLAAAHIEREPLDMFIKVNPMDHAMTTTRNPSGVGGAAEVSAIVSFHLDVDAGKDDRYLTPAKMLDALDAMPLAPSLIVQTNGDDGGFHPYWFFEKPHYITDDADRLRCQAISNRWLEELRIHAKPGTIDGTANIDRLLRPVGSLRKSGNRVAALICNPNRRFKLEQFVLPEIAKPTLIYNSVPRGDGESVIERYLDAVGLNSVAAILSHQGYTQSRQAGFWTRPGSQSGAPTGEIFVKDGKEGFTVKSGAADPLECTNDKGTNGKWYSVPALWVAFYHGGDWRKAAIECHEYFDAQKPKVDIDYDKLNQERDPQVSGDQIDPDVSGQANSEKDQIDPFQYEATEQASGSSKDQIDPCLADSINEQAATEPEPKSTSQGKADSKRTITIKARRMDSVMAEKINWWWPNKIPRGNLIMFAGQGGGGKSTACADLVARHTTGLPFPNDTEIREPENVAIINCEDDAATIQRPRLDAAGADCSRVHLLDALDIGGDELWIDFSNYSKPIEDYIVETKSTLLIIDPISGHIGGKKQNDTAEVREVLQKLQAIAKRTGCTIIAITHSPKAATSAQSSIIGSQAFVSCARAAFAFVVDKTDPKRRIMLNAKSNYSADETGLAFHIENVDGIGRVEWEADPVTEHPDSFFTPQTGGQAVNNSAVDHAAGLLSELLGEAKPKKEIDAWAKAQMISSATLRRAKDKNGHIAEKRQDGWYWLPMVSFEHWQS